MPSARELIAELLIRYVPRDWNVHGDAADEVLTALAAAGLLAKPEREAAQREAIARLTAALSEIRNLRPFTAQEGLTQAQEIARRALAAIPATRSGSEH